jgi:hypothetical protein
MSTSKKKTSAKTLEQIIEQFLEEKVGLGLLSIPEVARLHFHLVDSTVPLLHIGYVRFLKSCGVPEPKVEDLSEFWVGEYHEFLHQNYGELLMETAMDRLWELWDWASQNEYISGEDVPIALDWPRNPPSFRVHLTIADYPKPSKQP